MRNWNMAPVTVASLHTTFLDSARKSRGEAFRMTGEPRRVMIADARRRVYNARMLRTGEGKLQLPPLPKVA